MKTDDSSGAGRSNPDEYIRAAETMATWPTEKVHLTALRERRGPITGKSFAKTDIRGMASWMAERQSKPERLNIKGWDEGTAMARKHGPISCELDAIPAETLREMVRTVIRRHMPDRKLAQLKAAQRREREEILRLVGRMK